MGRVTPGAYTSGTISTQNLNPNSGVATANSAVELALSDDFDTAVIQTVGAYTGALSVQVSIDGTNWITLGGGQAITNVNTAAQTSTIASALQGIFQLDVSGFQRVRVTALAAVTGSVVVTLAGSTTNGICGIDTPIVLGAGSAAIGTIATPSGSAISLTSAASTNATSSKTSAGNLFEITADNFTAAIKYLKLYNKASAPTVGTDVPVLTVPIPANGYVSLSFGQNGKRFTTGIAFALTGNQAVADTTALAAGDVHVHGTYI